jgi:hypothetical protein
LPLQLPVPVQATSHDCELPHETFPAHDPEPLQKTAHDCAVQSMLPLHEPGELHSIVQLEPPHFTAPVHSPPVPPQITWQLLALEQSIDMQDVGSWQSTSHGTFGGQTGCAPQGAVVVQKIVQTPPMHVPFAQAASQALCAPASTNEASAAASEIGGSASEGASGVSARSSCEAPSAVEAASGAASLVESSDAPFGFCRPPVATEHAAIADTTASIPTPLTPRKRMPRSSSHTAFGPSLL